MTAWLAYLPSPPDSSIDLGPLSIRAYGLAIALGVIAAVAIAQRRWQRAGGNAEDISALALWAVPVGIVGARAYHVLTDLDRFAGRWHEALYVWKGGLGIPGGLLAGVLVGVLVAQRRNLPVARLLDAVAPAIPVAQAIGRLGNWFNQELFGGPTDLPWALRIDPDQRPARFADATTFHPTFAYEAIWNLGLAGLLVYIGRRFRLRDGTLFALYVAGYGAGRMWVESLRVDPAAMLWGLRFNVLVGGLAVIGGCVAAALLARRGTASPRHLLSRRPTAPMSSSTRSSGSVGPP